jgi:hypothetical protein
MKAVWHIRKLRAIILRLEVLLKNSKNNYVKMGPDPREEKA